jgi:hypothetical protein
MPQITKAHEITEAKISFVSLVDKAANKKKFLITKADSGSADFTTYGRILKADATNHFVTGIVYEPMVEDSQGDYMTEEEITKAAHWFMKNGGSVDVQHCFKKFDGAEVVESYVAKCDMEIDGQDVKKGTWIMTMEISDPDAWDSIQKGEITGFSMGGSGVHSKDDVALPDIGKAEETGGLLRKLAKALGFDVVEKGRVKERYNKNVKERNFYEAWYALDSVLHHNSNGEYELADDESEIRAALTEFNDIVTQILSSDVSIIKALKEERQKKGSGEGGEDAGGEESEEDSGKSKKASVKKAGKSLSTKNLSAIKGIYDTLGNFLSEFDEEEPGETANSSVKKEDADMTNEEVQKLVSEEVAKAMESVTKQVEAITKGNDSEGSGTETPPSEQATAESVAKMVGEEVAKAMEPMMKALEPVMKSRALPGNLNDAEGTVEKQEEHFLHGIV